MVCLIGRLLVGVACEQAVVVGGMNKAFGERSEQVRTHLLASLLGHKVKRQWI